MFYLQKVVYMKFFDCYALFFNGIEWMGVPSTKKKMNGRKTKYSEWHHFSKPISTFTCSCHVLLLYLFLKIIIYFISAINKIKNIKIYSHSQVFL